MRKHMHKDGDHGHAHDHNHDHGHTHTHEHTHEHDHGHGHAHSHAHGGGSGEVAKNIALLKYMLDHNRSHADELHDAGHKLEGINVDAAQLISEAVHYFNHGNEKLQKAVELLDKGE